MSKRVVLVKPGDILLIGNVGAIDPEDIREPLDKLKQTLGIAQILVFDEDIDIDAVPAS